MISKYKENEMEICCRYSKDMQKSRYSHDWKTADFESSNMLNRKCREPKMLLFEIGLVYCCTYNSTDVSNLQKAILFDLPKQEDLNMFKPIKVLLAPPGCKDVTYIEGMSKESYFERGFIEISIECSPHKIHILPNSLQGVRKQYGLQHYVAGTTHSIMGDTLSSIATTVSLSDCDFKLWDKGQLLVLISQTRQAEDTIFVGNKQDTLDALVHILRSRTQWTDYMEKVLNVVTVNQNIDTVTENVNNKGTMNQHSFPYRICDVSLPTDSSGYVYMLISLRSSDFVI